MCLRMMIMCSILFFICEIPFTPDFSIYPNRRNSRDSPDHIKTAFRD